jgi:predicted ATPase
MYLQHLFIENIRSLELLEWKIDPGSEKGWHVILGENGSGKTTFLRAAALGILPWKASVTFQGSAALWVRHGQSEGQILAEGDGWKTDKILRANKSSRGGGREEHDDFSAGYGPFRRFTGGDKELERQYSDEPAVLRHLSLFRESAALSEALAWMQTLRFKELERNAEGELLPLIRELLNQPGFLPHGARFADVTSDDVNVIDGNGSKVAVEDLSDGFRSILSMTFDLIRHMARGYDPAKLFSDDHMQIIRPGVVLIDEIDAHLHPTWQHDIGIWLRKLFPNVQFIVSTHSPIICQAAEVGSIFRLPRPGVEGDRGEMITGLARKRLIYGNVLDAYGTGVFGDDVTRSESGAEKLEQLAELNVKELTGTLTVDEQAEQRELRAILPTEASTTGEP